MLRRPPRSTLFPYTTLFRSRSPDWAQVHQAEYRAAQQPVIVGELGSGCVGCRTYPVEYVPQHDPAVDRYVEGDRKSTRLNSSHLVISYAVFCLKKKKNRSTY